MLNECRYTIRKWRRSPVFTIGVVGTLGVGLGATALMSQVLHALLLEGPPYVASPESAGRIYFEQNDLLNGNVMLPVSNYPTLTDLAGSEAFAGVAGSAIKVLPLRYGSVAVPATVDLVTANYFAVMGTHAAIGRVFSGRQESTQAVAPDAVLSMRLWREDFGGDTSIVGRPVVIGERTFTVIGIAPLGFAGLQTRAVDAWIPMEGAGVGVLPDHWRSDRQAFWLTLSVRLKAGVSRELAGARATSVLKADLRAAGSADTLVSVVVASPIIGRGPNRPPEVRIAVWIGVVALLLTLLSGANAAALIMANSLADRSELAIRSALGARGTHLMTRMMAEAILIAVPAGGLALVIGLLGRPFLEGTLLPGYHWPTGLPDPMTGAGVALLALLMSVGIQGLALRRALGGDVASALRTPQGLTHESSKTVLTMLGFESAVTTILVFGAIVFASSLRRVEALDLGVDLDHTMLVTFSGQHTATRREVAASYDEAERRLNTLREVDHVALAEANPYMFGRAIGPYTARRSWEELWRNHEAAYETSVGVGFFTTVGASHLKGRDFTTDDRLGSPRVAIIDRPLAEHLWPGGNALGRTFYYGNGATATVVGVLNSVWKFRLLDRQKMMVYFPLAQDTAHLPGALFVHFKGDSEHVRRDIFGALTGLSTDLGPPDIELMREEAEPTYRPWQLGTTMFTLFGIVAILVATGGMYSLVTYTTFHRRKEIAIRVAMGAELHHIIMSVAGRDMFAVVGGSIVGVVVTALVARVAGSILYRTSPTDPKLLVLTFLFIAGTSGLSGILAVWREARGEPSRVLREA
jgi:putative ABC transport system permease protein